jgi:hypothetical protein
VYPKFKPYDRDQNLKVSSSCAAGPSLRGLVFPERPGGRTALAGFRLQSVSAFHHPPAGEFLCFHHRFAGWFSVPGQEVESAAFSSADPLFFLESVWTSKLRIFALHLRENAENDHQKNSAHEAGDENPSASGRVKDDRPAPRLLCRIRFLQRCCGLSWTFSHHKIPPTIHGMTNQGIANAIVPSAFEQNSARAKPANLDRWIALASGAADGEKAEIEGGDRMNRSPATKAYDFARQPRIFCDFNDQ